MVSTVYGELSPHRAIEEPSMGGFRSAKIGNEEPAMGRDEPGPRRTRVDMPDVERCYRGRVRPRPGSARPVPTSGKHPRVSRNGESERSERTSDEMAGTSDEIYTRGHG